MAIKKWKKVKTEESYKCGNFYHIDKDKIITPGDKKSVYYVIRHPKKSVIVVPKDANGNFYLTRQHRYPINDFSLEFPSGSADENEIPLNAAKRELAEEMKLGAGSWKKLGIINAATGISDLEMNVFLAENIYPINKESADPIDINLHEDVVLTKKQLLHQIGHQVKASLSIAAFQLSEINSKKLKS